MFVDRNPGSNGSVIWDFAGNVWEWISYFNSDDKPTPLADAWNQYTAVSGTNTMSKTDLVIQDAITNSWDSDEGIGQYWPGTNTVGGSLTRSGHWFDGTGSGIFSACIDRTPTYEHRHVGFRCAVSVP